MSNKELMQALSTRIKQEFSLDRLLFYCSIELPHHLTKKNGRPIFMNRSTGKSFLGKDNRLRAMEDKLILEFKMARIAQGLTTPLKDRLWVISHFIFEPQAYYTQKNTINKRLPDLSNLFELPNDCLTKAGVIEDDTLIDCLDLSRRLVGEKTKLELFILKHE